MDAHREREALGSVSMASISSVFYQGVLNSLYVDQKSDLIPPSYLKALINSLENHGCFSLLSQIVI